MNDAVLVINAGSSTIKFAVWPLEKIDARRIGAQRVDAEDSDAPCTDVGAPDDEAMRTGAACADPLLRGSITRTGATRHFSVRDGDGEILADEVWDKAGRDDPDPFRALGAWIDAHLGGHSLIAAGHRVVHGGTNFTVPVMVDVHVTRELEKLIPLAPLQQPHNLAAIRSVAAAHPGLVQVACFDTAFHAGHADVATRFALPRAMHDAGVRRYGFHGLSYEYIARALARMAPGLAQGRAVVAHLGSGASVCAMSQGKSVDSTMGFTALDGLPMGTRCGNIDPGVLLFLMDQGMGADAMRHLLYHEFGLLGVSGGISNDMRELLASRGHEAAQAVALFVYRAVREITAMAASMNGLDAIVFTAGIGENSAEIRARICRDCAWLGVVLDPDANGRGTGRITSPHSGVAAWVIPTDEERMIALHTVETSRFQNGVTMCGRKELAAG